MLPQQNTGGMPGQFGGQQWGNDGNAANQRQQPVAGNQQQAQMQQFQLQQMQQQMRSQALLQQQQQQQQQHQGNQSQQMMTGNGSMATMGQLSQHGSMANNSSNHMMAQAQGNNPANQSLGGMSANMVNAQFPAMQLPNAAGAAVAVGGVHGQMMGGAVGGGGGPGGFSSQQQTQQQQQAQAALYWNALQASGMANPAQKMQQMQLQQQMQKQQQGQQGHAMTAGAPGGGMQTAVAMNPQQQGQMQQLQQLQQLQQQQQQHAGGSGSDNNQQQGQGGAQADMNQAQLLLQQQGLIAQLQQQIQQQRQQSNISQTPQQMQQGGAQGQQQQQSQPQQPGVANANPMLSSPNNLQQQLGGNAMAFASMKPQQQQQQNAHNSPMQFPQSMGNANAGIMQGLLQQQQQQQQQLQQCQGQMQQHQLGAGSTTSLTNLGNMSAQPQQMSRNNGNANKSNEQIDLQGLFGNTIAHQPQQQQQQQHTPAPSNPNTPSLGPLAFPNHNNNNNSTKMGSTNTPAPSNAGDSSTGGGASVTGPSNGGSQMLQNGNQQNQSLLDAMRRTPSTQPNTDSNNSSAQQQQQQQQQLLMAQMLQQQQMQMGGMGNTGEPGQGIMLEQRVKQFQVMQHLQQLQQQKQVADSGATGSQQQRNLQQNQQQNPMLNGNNTTQQQSQEESKQEESSQRSASANLRAPAQGQPTSSDRRGSHISHSDEGLNGGSPIPLAIGATLSSSIPGIMPRVVQMGNGGGSSSNGQQEDGGQGDGSSLDGDGLGTQQSFLDGHFAGGWQSNVDLPDRRRIIFSIIKVIERMRPDANRMSQNRLPLMAKKLEEHLYRSSHTKNEYIDPASLKRRLHLIAKGVGVPKHALGGAEDTIGLLFAGMDEDDDDDDDGFRGDASTVSNQSVMQPLPAPSQSTSAGVLGMGSNPEEATSNQDQHQQLLMSLQAQGNVNKQILMQQLRQQQQLSQQQQLQQVLGSQQQNNSRPGSTNNISSNVVLDQLQRNMSQAASSGVPDELSANLQALVGSAVGQNSNPQRVVTESNGSDARSEKKKIILQQQQRRLLLLRHASKCDGGPNCRTRFCPQMVTLWKHMKKCRDKNCKVSHCLSIRCLLNHYRICKREGLTSSCEICAPVMKHIRQQSDQNSTDLSESDPMDQMAGDQMAGLNDTHDPLDAFSPSADGESQADVQLSNVSSLEPLDAFTMLENNMNILSRMDPSNPTPNPALMQMINAMMQPALQNNGTGSIQEEITKKQALLQQVQQQKANLVEQSEKLQQQLRIAPNQQQAQHLRKQQALLQQLNTHFDQQQTIIQREIQHQTLLLQQQMNQQANPSSENNISPSSPNDMPDLMQVDNSSSSPPPELDQGEVASSGGNDAKSDRKKKVTNKEGDSKIISHSRGKGSRAASSGKKLTKKKGRPKKDADIPGLPSLPPLPPPQPFAAATKTSKRSSDCLSTADGELKDENQPSSKLAKLDNSSAQNEEKKKEMNHSSDSAAATGGKENENRTTETENASLTVSAKKQLTDGSQDKDSQLIPSMSAAAIEQHLDSLISIGQLTPRRIARKCLPLVRKLRNHEFGWVFREPVDPVELGIPDYFDIVEHPMDLALVEKKLENGVYKDFDSFERETKLVFQNAILFNGASSDVGEMANSLLELFEEDLKIVMKDTKIEKEVNTKKKGDVCALCKNHRLLFEPITLVCSGSCGMQKIRRNANYYTDRNKQNYWCERCHGGLTEADPVQLDDGKETTKSLLLKLKNDATPEESWVQCDECHDWVHQICALFNPRQNVKSPFTCPKCHLKAKTADEGNRMLDTSFKDAKDLPQCKMSEAMEERLSIALLKAYEKVAQDRGCTVAQVEKAEDLTIRVVSSLEKKHKVREEMLAKYLKKEYPSEFPVKSKCILLFQKIHGVDVLLFGMYVYEYGENCPAPNRRRVYISYLDSVRYIEPSSYRTLIYQTIIVEYLRYVKSRGFHTAHIWSCPPSKGDEYIFHCHPSQQLTPRDDMLCAWYIETLNIAKDEGVVLETRTLYDEYFKNDGIDPKTGEAFDPTSIPYFDGDYIPGEIENIIKELKKDDSNRKASHPKPASATQKKEGKRTGTRSNPGDLINQERDKVMMRLGLVLARMKQNFIVAQLLSDDFIHAVDKGEDVSSWTEEQPKPKGKNPSILECPHSINNSTVKDAKSTIEDSALALKTIGNTEDEDPLMEQECLDTRLHFLNYCQKNNFQFDKLRHAKYTTMMLLCHLHNPRTERDQQIKVHLEVIAHASSCSGSPGCVSSNCLRMKQLFDHVKGCDVTFKRGCKICVRLFMLLTKHARDCDSQKSCPIPFCDRIRERNRRLLKQQQLMDDRRRNAQNDRHRPENESECK